MRCQGHNNLDQGPITLFLEQWNKYDNKERGYLAKL